MSDYLQSLRFTRGNVHARARLSHASIEKPQMGWGEVGEGVRVIQQSLIDLGFRLPRSTGRYGSPDGIFGDETKEAVRAFQLDQQRFGLKLTGVVDRATIFRLDQFFQQPGAVPLELPALPAGSSLTHKFTVAFRPITSATPDVPASRMLEAARVVYGMYGFRIDEEPAVTLPMTPREQRALDIYKSSCKWDLPPHEETDSQKLLFSLERRMGAKDLEVITELGLGDKKLPAALSAGRPPHRRSGAGPTTILVFIVSGMYGPDGRYNGIRGCAAHRPGDPAVVIRARNITHWLMAHEVGHVLLGSSFQPVHSDDESNLMFKDDIEYNYNAGLTEGQVRAIRRSPSCLRIR
jgi:hypothetical protein